MAGLLLAGTAQAKTLHVGDDSGEYEDLGDDAPGSGGCDVGDGRCTLRAAIEESNATGGSDRIVLHGGGRFELTRGQLVIAETVTIAGMGEAPIIDAQGNSRVIAICTPGVVEECPGSGELRIGRGPFVLIHNVTIRRGVVNGGDRFSAHLAGGGGIVVGREATLLLSKSKVEGNVARNLGGGILSFGTLSVVSSAITDNRTSAAGPPPSIGGGGVMILPSKGTTNFEQSLIQGNSAWVGGGIGNIGSALQIRNSTLSGNRAEVAGGGLLALPEVARTDISFSTITENRVDDEIEPVFGRTYGGGGIYNWGTLVLGNSIVAANVDRHDPFDLPVDADRAPDCKLHRGGVLISAGNNIIGDADACPRGSMPGGAMAHDRVGARLNPIDPRLAALADNAGPTLTHALQRGSPAIDFVTFHVLGFFASPPHDQRGFDRPGRFGGHARVADAGAYEAGAKVPILVDPNLPVLPPKVIAGTTRDLVLPLPIARTLNRPLQVRARDKDIRITETLRTTYASAIVRVEIDGKARIGPRSLVVEFGEDTFEVPMTVVIDRERAENVAVDIMPGTCPNTLASKSEGALRAAFLGSERFAASDIDPATVRLEGVAAVSNRLADVGAPAPDEKASCPDDVDKVQDLELEFDRAEVMGVAGPVVPGLELSLELTAALADGTPIRGHDVVVFAN